MKFNMRHIFRRSIMWITMLIICVSILSVTVFAATVTVSGDLPGLTDNYLSISAENESGASCGEVTVSQSGEYIIIEITANKMFMFGTTTKVTITNTSGKKLKISYGTSTDLGTTETISSGDSISTLSVTSKVKTTTYYLKYEVAPETFDVTFSSAANGTYKVDGTAVSASSYTPSGSAQKDNVTAYTLVASAADNYEFGAWASSVDGVISTDASYSYICTKAETIYPVFKVNGCALYYVPGDTSGDYYCSHLDTACTAASDTSTKKVIVVDDGTVSTSSGSTMIDLPSGVTVLLPYALGANTVATSTTTDESGSCNSTYIHANATFTSDQYDNGNVRDQSVAGVMEPNTGVYLTLTVPKEITINVNSGSKLVIGGTIVSGTVMTGGICGATASGHSNIQLEGTMNVNDGGILSCCGYIKGDGSVNIASGGSVYQPFIVADHHDGHFVANSKDESYFPFARHTMLNIQSKIAVVSGASMYGYLDVFTQKTTVSVYTLYSQHNVDCQKIIGSGSDSCLIILSSGAKLEISYDASQSVTVYSSNSNNTTGYYSKIGKTTLRITGGASLGTITVSVKVPVLGKQAMYSGDATFPVPYNYDIYLENGAYALSEAMSLLPGSNMTIDDGATLSITSGGSLAVFDGLRDYSKTVSTSSPTVSTSSWPSYHYPGTTDLQKSGYSGTANLVVNGTMTVYSGGSFGGVAQTDGETGIIVMESGCSNSVTAEFGIAHKGQSLFSQQATNPCAGKTVRTLTAQAYFANGLTTLTEGNTYYAVGTDENTIENYSYDLYADGSNPTTITASHTETLNATVKGNWCTAPGHVDADADLKCDNCETPMARLAAIEASADAEVLLKLKFRINSDLINDGYAVVTKQGENGNAVGTSDTYYFNDMVPDSGGRYIFSMGIASGEMTRPVTVQIFDGDGNLVSITDYADESVYTTVSRTVVDYAKRVLENSSNDKQINIVKALVTYGGYAQIRFNVDMQNPAYSILGSSAPVLDVSIDDFTQETSVSGDDIGISQSALNAYLNSAIYLRVYFELDADEENNLKSIDQYKFILTYTVNHAEKTMELTPTYDTTNDRYYVDILDIPAAYFDYMYKIEVISDERTYTVSTSVLAYLKAVMDSTSVTEDHRNLARAMYLYNQAANEFFGK